MKLIGQPKKLRSRFVNESKLSTYLNFCTEVYDLSKPEPPKDAYAFYLDYVKNAKGLILEPMCGTGRFLLPLCEEGFNVHGFDASDHMLKKLHEKAQTKGITPKVWKSFVEDFISVESYDLIFIPAGSFCLVIEEKTVELVLKKFYDYLTEDGIFLFEVETYNLLPPLGVWRETLWYRENGNKLLLSQYASFNQKVCTTICKYELIDSNKVTHREIEELKVRIYEPNEIIELARQAGFRHVRVIKGFDKNQDLKEAGVVFILECRK